MRHAPQRDGPAFCIGPHVFGPNSKESFMPADAPHHRYFRGKEGRWRGKFQFEITNQRALSSSPLSWFEKWVVSAAAFFSRHVSGPSLSTTVDYSGQGAENRVLHTTQISILGLTLFRSTEIIFLDPDGGDFRMTGQQSFFPFFSTSSDWTAHGSVSPEYDQATYRIPWFGLTMEQKTNMTNKGLEIIQTTSFSRAVVLLQRQGPLKAEPAERA